MEKSLTTHEILARMESLLLQLWTKRSKPTLKKVVEPQRKYTDLILSNNSQEELHQNVNEIKNYIKLYFNNKEKFQKELKKVKKNHPTIKSKF
jgi:uridine kinase